MRERVVKKTLFYDGITDNFSLVPARSKLNARAPSENFCDQCGAFDPLEYINLFTVCIPITQKSDPAVNLRGGATIRHP